MREVFSRTVNIFRKLYLWLFHVVMLAYCLDTGLLTLGESIESGIMSGFVKVRLRFRMSMSTSITHLTNTNIHEMGLIGWLKVGDTLGEVWIDGKQINLPRKEYRFIVCLHRRAGKVCTREELISEVWPEVLNGSGVSDAAIDQLVHRLRYKIEIDPAQPKRLISQRGFGYMLI